jgi:hypothetical protein
MKTESRNIIKRAGIVGLAKAIASDGDARGLTEHQLVEIVTAHALAENPNQSGAQAFAKKFTAATPDGALLRQAAWAASA